MWHLIQQLNSDHIFVLTIIGGGLTFLTLVSLVPALAYQWRQVRDREAATEVVHYMLHEGKSVEEIERVLQAGGFGQRSKEFAAMNFGCRKPSRRHAYSPSHAEHA
jgi:hypothetical protein